MRPAPAQQPRLSSGRPAPAQQGHQQQLGSHSQTEEAPAAAQDPYGKRPGKRSGVIARNRAGLAHGTRLGAGGYSPYRATPEFEAGAASREGPLVINRGPSKFYVDSSAVESHQKGKTIRGEVYNAEVGDRAFEVFLFRGPLGRARGP